MNNHMKRFAIATATGTALSASCKMASNEAIDADPMMLSGKAETPPNDVEGIMTVGPFTFTPQRLHAMLTEHHKSCNTSARGSLGLHGEPAWQAPTVTFMGVQQEPGGSSSWEAHVCGGQQVHVGVYSSELQAAVAHDLVAMKLTGSCAPLNFSFWYYMEEYIAIQQMSLEELLSSLRASQSLAEPCPEPSVQDSCGAEAGVQLHAWLTPVELGRSHSTPQPCIPLPKPQPPPSISHASTPHASLPNQPQSHPPPIHPTKPTPNATFVASSAAPARPPLHQLPEQPPPCKKRTLKRSLSEPAPTGPTRRRQTTTLQLSALPTSCPPNCAPVPTSLPNSQIGRLRPSFKRPSLAPLHLPTSIPLSCTSAQHTTATHQPASFFPTSPVSQPSPTISITSSTSQTAITEPPPTSPDSSCSAAASAKSALSISSASSTTPLPCLFSAASPSLLNPSSSVPAPPQPPSLMPPRPNHVHQTTYPPATSATFAIAPANLLAPLPPLPQPSSLPTPLPHSVNPKIAALLHLMNTGQQQLNAASSQLLSHLQGLQSSFANQLSCCQLPSPTSCSTTPGAPAHTEREALP